MAMSDKDIFNQITKPQTVLFLKKIKSKYGQGIHEHEYYDICMESIGYALRGYDPVRGKFEAYLARPLIGRLTNERNKQKKRHMKEQEAAFRSDKPRDGLELIDLTDFIETHVSHMSSGHQTIARKFFLQKESVDEISAELEVNQSVVSTVLGQVSHYLAAKYAEDE